MEDHSIHLSPEVVQQCIPHIMKIEAYKQLARAQEYDLNRILHLHYGINLSDHWNLNIEQGVLSRDSDTAKP